MESAKFPSRFPSRLEGQVEKRGSLLATVALFVFFVVFFGLVSNFLASRANAQAALANDPATLAERALESGEQRSFLYNGQLIFETSRTANEAEPISYSGWYQLIASALHVESGINSTIRTGYVREYSYQRDDGSFGSTDNPVISVSKPFLNGKDFESGWLDSIAVGLSGTIGANDESKRRSFLWSNGVSVLGAKTIGKWNLRQGVRYVHGFFEFDIQDDGVVNSPHTFRSTTMAIYSVSDKLSFSGSFLYNYAISFQGVGRATTMAQAGASYQFTNQLSASLGVGSERGTLEPDGDTNRIRFYAPESATYSFDLTVSL